MYVCKCVCKCVCMDSMCVHVFVSVYVLWCVFCVYTVLSHEKAHAVADDLANGNVIIARGDRSDLVHGGEASCVLGINSGSPVKGLI